MLPELRHPAGVRVRHEAGFNVFFSEEKTAGGDCLVACAIHHLFAMQ